MIVATIVNKAMMTDRIVEFHEPVTLLGGGEADPCQLKRLLRLAPHLIAADGGANMAVAEGFMPDLVVGDFDSVSAAALAAIPAERHMRVAEQETTDFEKCLMRIGAPLFLGLGFTGARADHTLAACNALVRHPDRACILLGDADLIFTAPPELLLDLPPGTRLSLFPMAPLGGRSEGLRWPIDGLTLAPAGRIGTSNEVTGPVRLRFAVPGMLVLLPVDQLDAAIRALRSADPWPRPSARPAVRGE